MLSKNNLALVFRKVKLSDQKSDFAYWQSQTYQARLSTLEQIRQEYHRWRFGAEPGFQRIYTIMKRASGRLQDLADLENLEE